MKKMLIRALAVLCVFVSEVRADEFEQPYEAIIASKGSVPEAGRLHELFEVAWAYNMANSPEWATYVGLNRYDG